MSGSELERSKENGGLHTRLKFIFVKFVIAVNGPNSNIYKCISPHKEEKIAI